MFTVKLEFNPEKILSERGLNKNGKAQKYFTNEVWKHSDKYVPYHRGGLKSNVQINTNNIVYKMPYARKQFYTNRGNGIDGINKGGLKGSYWTKRAWAIEGDEILNNLANKIGGHIE